MNKLLGLLCLAGVLILTSCETTKEITFKEDGSGTITTTTDMSAMIGLAKMSGQGEKMDEAEKVDTTVSLDKMADSIKGISAEEKALIKKGTLGINMNMADEKFVFKLQFPFTNGSQIAQLEKLSGKVMQDRLKDKMNAGAEGEEKPAIPEDALPESSIDDYYTTTYQKGVIEKKLNKEKYAKIGDDKGMESLKEAGGQGMAMNNTIILNLPRAAKKAEGKNVKLSDDKKKVTITTSSEDFFDDATKLEFKVEY